MGGSVRMSLTTELQRITEVLSTPSKPSLQEETLPVPRTHLGEYCGEREVRIRMGIANRLKNDLFKSGKYWEEEK